MGQSNPLNNLSEILKSPKIKLLLVVLIISATVIFLNRLVTRSFNELVPEPKQVAVKQTAEPIEKTPEQLSAAQMPTSPITHESFLEPNRKFYFNTIFFNDKKIAEFKSTDDVFFDVIGIIPDGRVNFTDATKSTQGYEFFKDGLREGEYTEYHSQKGNIWFKKFFSKGKIIKITEYFEDGSIRMKADYTDALKECAVKDNGTGIVYRHSGQPMYEWHLTNLDINRYKKFYNNIGTYEGIQYFDNKGRPTTEIQPVNSGKQQ